MTVSITTPATHTWVAEPDGKGFWRVYDQNAVLIAQHCIVEDALLVAAAPSLLKACEALASDDHLFTNLRRVYAGERAAFLWAQIRGSIAEAGRPAF